MTGNHNMQQDARKAACTLFECYFENNSFPQSLQVEEEVRHLKLMAEGEQHSRNLLIEHNLRLVAHIVNKFDYTGEDMEQLISFGINGLIKAIENYLPDKGTKLATFAARCIENEILIHLSSLKKTCKDHHDTDRVTSDSLLGISDEMPGDKPDNDIIAERAHPGETVLRVFMNAIHTSNRDTYNIVANNLSQESKKSMQRLSSLLGGARQPIEEESIGDRRS